jgi:hypothetical protein
MVGSHELDRDAMAGRVGVDRGRGPVRRREDGPIQIEVDVPPVRDQVRGRVGDHTRSRQAETDPDGGRIARQHLLWSRGEDRDAGWRRGTHRCDLGPEHGGHDERQYQGRRGQDGQRPAGVPGAPENADVPGPDRGPRQAETAKQEEGLDAFLLKRRADSIGENDTHPRQILCATRAGRGRPGPAAGRHRGTERPRTVTAGWSGRSTRIPPPRPPSWRQCGTSTARAPG